MRILTLLLSNLLLISLFSPTKSQLVQTCENDGDCKPLSQDYCCAKIAYEVSGSSSTTKICYSQSEIELSKGRILK